jgi:hypothetical protein
MLPDFIELVEPTYGPGVTADGGDAVWELRAPGTGYGRILVEAKASVQPRDVERLAVRLTPLVRQMMQNPTVLVVAPWLSRRTREVLEQSGFGYLDLTGNVFLRHERPAIYLRVQGADRDPNRGERSPVRLNGPKARGLARLLVDFMPPHRLTDLARVGRLNPGYVSQLLGALDEQAIIDRSRRGFVESVDWPQLLRLAAANYSLVRNNNVATFVAPEGASALYRRLANGRDPDITVTGSFAAAHVRPIASPTQLVLYSDELDAVRRIGRLLPADRSADVLILQAEDSSQLERSRPVDGTRHVGLSQLVIDCLGGPGRLPQEGEAVMDWMHENEKAWRIPSLKPAADQ